LLPLSGLARNTLDAAHLDSSTCTYLNEGLSLATRRTYSTGKQSFTSFCITTRNRILPTTESALLLFVSCLASKKTLIQLLKFISQLCATCTLLLACTDPSRNNLPLILKGIKRTQAISTSRRTRLPITLQIMSGIKECLSRQPHSQSSIMLWATCCLAFFGFL